MFCFNDGDMHHLHVRSDEERKTLVMAREEARVLINFGSEAQTFSILDGETLELSSRKNLQDHNNTLELPPMTLAVLLSSSEAVENRRVASRTSQRT